MSNIERVGRELLKKYSLPHDLPYSPKAARLPYFKENLDGKHLTYKKETKNTIVHRYVAQRLEEDSRIDSMHSLSWTQNHFITISFEGYEFAIQEEKIVTKSLVKKRDSDALVILGCNRICRLYPITVENIKHVISSRPKMLWYYLLMRHNAVDKTIDYAEDCTERN